MIKVKKDKKDYVFLQVINNNINTIGGEK